MNLTIKSRYYTVRLDPALPYNCLLSKKLTGNGSRDGYYLSNLLVTVEYERDDRTGAVLSDPNFTVQQDGNHLGGRLIQIGKRYQNQRSPNCWDFEFRLQMIFNEGVVNRQKLTASGQLGAEKGVKGGLTVGGELGEDRPASLYTLNFVVMGALSNISRELYAEVRIL